MEVKNARKGVDLHVATTLAYDGTCNRQSQTVTFPSACHPVRHFHQRIPVPL